MRDTLHLRSAVVETNIFIATVLLVLVTWLLYKLAEWLEPRQ